MTQPSIGARFRAAVANEQPLQVMGAITAYAGSWIMACVLERFGVFGALYRGVLQPAIGPLFGDKAASLAFAFAFVAFWWLLMWAMAKRGIRISV